MANPMSKHRWHLAFGFLALGLVVLLVASPSAQASSDPSFNGTADSVFGNVNGQAISATPVNLPADGSPQQNSLATFTKTVSGVTISATDLQASTALEASSTVLSDASLKNIKVTIGNNTITADAATAHAQATCKNGVASATGNSSVTNLVVNNVQNPSSPVDLPGFGSLVINFQREGGSSTSDNIRVDALGFFTSANTVAPVLEIPIAGAGTTDCPTAPGSLPPTGGGPIAPTGDRTPWMLWGSLLALLGLTGLGGTLVTRRRGLR